MERQVLRPEPRHSLPIVVLSVLGTLAGLALAVGFVAAKNPGGAVVMLVAALVVGGACIAYFRNASVWFDSNQVGKVICSGKNDASVGRLEPSGSSILAATHAELHAQGREPCFPNQHTALDRRSSNSDAGGGPRLTALVRKATGTKG